ncbi:MAG: VWA domain-containing protein [Bacteroidales bacterium]|nr:VWA domain-containing protein [Bacteroidales bacterium]
MRRFLLIASLVIAIQPLFAGVQFQNSKFEIQNSERVRILLLVDCSRSMWDKWQSDSKIKVTQKVLLHFLDSLPEKGGAELAMRVFGHLNQNSYGTRLECPFEPNNRYQLQSKIKTLVPNGGCTAATALDGAVGDFPAGDSSRNVIFVITDGKSGGSNICEVARKIQLSGRVVKTFIFNIAANANHGNALDCAGEVIQIADEERFAGELQTLFHTVRTESRVVVTLTNEAGEVFSGDVPVVFYDRQNSKPVYTKVYYGGPKSKPDTVTVDPLISYDVEVFTRPSIVFKNRTFKPDRVYTLASAVEEGRLCVRREDKRVVWSVPDYQVVVRQSGKADLTGVQGLGDSVKYLEGIYDIEILSMPPIAINNVEIRRDAVTELAIPAPGMLMFERMKARKQVSVFELRDGRMQLVREFVPNPAGENLILMPGDYILIIKPLGKNPKATTTTTAQIQSGKQTVAKID